MNHTFTRSVYSEIETLEASDSKLLLAVDL